MASSSPVRLIGVDCAAQHKRFGVALGELNDHGVRVLAASTGHADVLPILREWCEADPATPTVLAFDAPLGWPAPLGPALNDHAAGDPLPADSNALFRRATDDFVAATLGKRPLEVAADKIARVAVRALRVLADLRTTLGRPLPLLWEPGSPPALTDEATGGGAIEVYPAATLSARGLPLAGYKAKGAAKRPLARAARTALLERLANEVRFEADRESLIASDDALDAAVCVLAAADFARGAVARPPTDLPEATLRREGWIWFGPPPTLAIVGSPTG